MAFVIKINGKYRMKSGNYTEKKKNADIYHCSKILVERIARMFVQDMIKKERQYNLIHLLDTIQIEEV